MILLVEHNAVDEERALNALSRKNKPNVVVVRDGMEAIDFLLGPNASVRPLPHVVFLNLALPKMDGPEVLQRIREADRTKRVPVIMLKSVIGRDEVEIAHCYALGANGFVVKSRQFFDAFDFIADMWLNLNQITPRLS